LSSEECGTSFRGFVQEYQDQKVVFGEGKSFVKGKVEIKGDSC